MWLIRGLDPLHRIFCYIQFWVTTKRVKQTYILCSLSPLEAARRLSLLAQCFLYSFCSIPQTIVSQLFVIYCLEAHLRLFTFNGINPANSKLLYTLIMRVFVALSAVLAICLLPQVKSSLSFNSDPQAEDKAAVSYKVLILRFTAIMNYGIRADLSTGQFVYDTGVPFQNRCLFFQNRTLEMFRKSLQKQYGILIAQDYTQHKLIAVLESRLREFGTQPLKQYVIEAEELREELTSIAAANKTMNPAEEEALSKRVLEPLGRLYDRTYGTNIKQSEADKFILLLGYTEHGSGLKEFFDPRRKVFGMKSIESMPKTFKYFHSKAKKISSEYDQDGVIQAIFEAIQDNYQNGKYFVKVGSGSQSDYTSYLRDKQGWQGKLFHSGTKPTNPPGYPISNEYVGPESVAAVFQRQNVPKQFDFLRIDVHSRDCWIWAAIAKDYHPAVVSVQFNSNFGFDLAVSVPRLSSAAWGQENGYFDKHYGCSIKSAVDIATEHGYAYVWHHPFSDAIFVRQDLLPADLPPVDIKKTFDPFPLHFIDCRFKEFAQLNTNEMNQIVEVHKNDKEDAQGSLTASLDPYSQKSSFLPQITGHNQQYVIGIVFTLGFVSGVISFWICKSASPSSKNYIEMRSGGDLVPSE